MQQILLTIKIYCKNFVGMVRPSLFGFVKIKIKRRGNFPLLLDSK
jgi:hypothetical protein